MIARSWWATATADGARQYAEHFRTAVLPELRATAGFRTAYVMRRASGDVVRIQVLTFWESMTAIAGFAGNTVRTAVVGPVAQSLLLDFDTTVEHYEAQQH